MHTIELMHALIIIASFTDCSVPANGSGLDPLEDFTYANSFMGCVIQWSLAQTNFSGVSVSISCEVLV